MIKNLFLIVFSTILALTITEFFLSKIGKYKNLTENNLVPSPAIYERSFSSTQVYQHPDLKYKVISKFDEDGVKNFDQTTTSDKKNIIALFGDSFTENIAIDKNFEYSLLLNNHTPSHQVVNYGVGGYSADQVFVRFLKYKNHDIKYVFYLFFTNDIFFKTKSKFNADGSYSINKPDVNIFFKAIGKLNLTYLAIDIYYYLKSKFKKSYTLTNIENYNSILSDKLFQKFYNTSEISCDYFYNYINTSSYDFNFDDCSKNFLNLMSIFKNEVEKINAKFYILVYPENKNLNFFKNFINQSKNNFDYIILDKKLHKGTFKNNKKITFKNDAHWSEYRNLYFASHLLEIFENIKIPIEKIDLEKKILEIDNFYKKIKD